VARPVLAVLAVLRVPVAMAATASLRATSLTALQVERVAWAVRVALAVR
jgi:hypothetical protein